MASQSNYTDWHSWLGLPHRLGADPREGEACCCLKMAHIMMTDLGLNPPDIKTYWKDLARQHRWSDLYEEFQLVTVESPNAEELWTLVPLMTPMSFGIGVVVPDRLLLGVHHRQGVTTVPLDKLRTPSYHTPV